MQTMDDYDVGRLTMKEATSILNISRDTLYSYVKKGMIRKYHINQRKVLYSEEDVYGLIGKRYKKDDKIVIYARVANGHRKHDLDEQVERVTSWCIKNGLQVRGTYTDVCRSLEFRRSKRGGFHAMLREVIAKKVDSIVMESPDRLARIGHDLFFEICKYYKVKIIYLNTDPVNVVYKDEVKDELKSVILNIKSMYDNHKGGSSVHTSNLNDDA
jgi:putative resolvase